VPARSVATFQSKGGGSGEKVSFLLVGADIQLQVIISDRRDVVIVLEATP